MKKLHFFKPNALSRLHDEILVAMPGLAPEMRVEGLGDDIWLTVPDTADEAAITVIVQAHDATRPVPRTPDPDLAAWTAATTIVDIKAILADPKLRKELLDRATKAIIQVMRWG